ncbi:MAG: prolipoprotein diacylglyceryl transferase, partial [Bacteroidetes bacterium]|nr:prolipoprotein diacylglyceryl transferase [Bacteroidota bacterium]
MKILFIIATTHGDLFYSITYLTSILMVAAMTIYIGFDKGYPKISWFLLVMSGGLFFIIGEKAFSYSSGQWMQVFQGFPLPPTQKKTILGGILGLFAGLILAKIWLRFHRPILDNFAIALPLAMAISRIGCLMAGCCFGTTTNLPWGINYGSSSMVYHSHMLKGLVHFHDKISAAVHPIQVYEMLGCLII